MKHNYLFLVASILTLSCGPSEPCKTRTVTELVKANYRNVTVKFDDGTMETYYSPTIKPGDKRCVKTP